MHFLPHAALSAAAVPARGADLVRARRGGATTAAAGAPIRRGRARHAVQEPVAIAAPQPVGAVVRHRACHTSLQPDPQPLAPLVPPVRRHADCTVAERAQEPDAATWQRARGEGRQDVEQGVGLDVALCGERVLAPRRETRTRGLCLPTGPPVRPPRPAPGRRRRVW